MGHGKQERPKYLAEKLLKIRTKLGFSQPNMAKALEARGVKAYPGYVARFELGERVPGPLTLLAYAQLARITIEDLVDDKKNLPKGF